MSSFMLLALVSGIAVGLGKVVTTLYALQLGAGPAQIGIISAMESAGMILVTVPAGFIIARYGARPIYFIASLGPLLVNLALPFAGGWVGLAVGRWLVGLCIPFRMISMNSSFLERLRSEGETRGGWYRGSLTAGLAIVGPALAGLITLHAGTTAGFLVVAALFGAMALFSLSFMPERDEAPGEEARPLRTELAELVRDPLTRESCLIEFLGAATSGLFGTYIILLAIALPPLDEHDGIRILLIQGLTAVAMLFLGGRLVVRLSREQTYAVGLALAVAALLSLGFAHGIIGLASGAIFLSAATALVHLVNVRMLSSRPGTKSKVAGLYNLATMTGSTGGALGGAAISQVAPLQSIFLLWLPVLLAGATAVSLLHRGDAHSLASSEI